MRGQPLVVYLNNAIDESVKELRKITTDSPAATNKVFAISNAMQHVGMRCIVLSMGRGRQNGSRARFDATFKRCNHGVVLYASFWHWPLLTHVVSLVSLAWLLGGIIRKRDDVRVLAYNRGYHYVLALAFARLLGAKIYLDLEDGYNLDNKGWLYHFKNTATRLVFNWLCPHGSMAANRGLSTQLQHASPIVCYGVMQDQVTPAQNWQAARLNVLFSGTLLEEVGSLLLLATVDILRKEHPALVQQLHFVVTGKGPCAEQFRKFSTQFPEWLSFELALSRSHYLEVLKNCHIGLSLRLSAFEMGQTTFPSKVIEYAEYGLLVTSTRVSDVPELFGTGACYLEEQTAEALARLLINFVCTRDDLQRVALLGRAHAIRVCSPDVVGFALKQLLIN